jgi:hypothetical protein
MAVPVTQNALYSCFALFLADLYSVDAFCCIQEVVFLALHKHRTFYIAISPCMNTLDHGEILLTCFLQSRLDAKNPWQFAIRIPLVKAGVILPDRKHAVGMQVWLDYHLQKRRFVSIFFVPHYRPKFGMLFVWCKVLLCTNTGLFTLRFPLAWTH